MTSLYSHDISMVLFWWIIKQIIEKNILSLETAASLEQLPRYSAFILVFQDNQAPRLKYFFLLLESTEHEMSLSHKIKIPTIKTFFMLNSVEHERSLKYFSLF